MQLSSDPRRAAIRRRGKYLAILAVFAFIAIAGLWLLRYAPLPFVASWWGQGGHNWNDPLKKRHRIADRLISTGELLGRSRAALEAQLGVPSDEGYFKQWDMVYLLGAERGFVSIDSEWLVIRLGSDGRAREVANVRD